MAFKVEQLYIYGWDDAGWTCDDEPMVFQTQEEAQVEINEVIASSIQACETGDMASPYTAGEYRIKRKQQ